MVRIHVVRASHLILWVVGVLLAGALVWVLATTVGSNETNGKTYAQRIEPMAETEAVFASASAVFAPEEAEDMQVEVVRREEMPRVLIYHTHTHEAYRQDADDVYVETSTWRTRDNAHNVVRVGEALAEELTERGFIVLHDETDHELNSLGTAYTRSLETMKHYAGDVDIFIDLHRDAYAKGSSGNPPRVTVDGRDSARLMFLVGNGVGFTEKPYYAENYELATILTNAINTLAPGLCRPVMVKDGRYNQHVSPNSLLIEVGHNENSLEEALNAIPYLADAMQTVFRPGEARLVRTEGE